MQYRSVLLAGLLVLLLPAASQAASGFDSVLLTTEPGTAGSTEGSFSGAFTPSSAISSGTTVYMGFREVVTRNPLVSGFSFSAASFGPALGSSGSVTGTMSELADGIAAILFTTNVPASQVTFGVSSATFPDDANCYEFFMTTSSAQSSEKTFSNTFTIGGDDCELSDITAAAGASSVDISWTGDDASSYLVEYATSEDALDTDPSTKTVEGVSDQDDYSATIADLTEGTDYFYRVSPLDSDGANKLFTGSTQTFTTSVDVTDTRMAKPTVPTKKIQKRQATVKWEAPQAASTIDHYVLQLYKKKSGKLVKKFKNIDNNAVKKVIKKKHLKAGTTYKVRIRAVLSDGQKYKFSKYRTFTTGSQ